MHAYLILGEKGLEKAIEDIVKVNSITLKLQVNKIDDVRSLQDQAKYSLDKTRYFVLENFDKATTEAMNAFLKLLEEPAKNTVFILCATSRKNILETIISRCHLIRLGHHGSEKSYEKALEFIELDKRGRLDTLHKISARDDALKFLNNLIDGGHQIVIKGQKSEKNISEIVEAAITAKLDLEKNANVTVALSKFTLDLVRQG